MRHLICLALAIAGLPAADVIVPTGTLSGTQTFGPAETVGTATSGTTIEQSGATIWMIGRTTTLRGGFSVQLGGTLHIRSGPWTVQGAQANPNPIVAAPGTTTLTCLGGDPGGEASLTYTWYMGSGPGPVTFSANGTNAAKTTTATITAPGTYLIRCLITNTSGGSIATNAIVSKNIPPLITSGPTATPATVTGTTSSLAIVATDDGGPGNLTYAWSAVSVPVGQTVGFAPNNGVEAAKTTATFSGMGSYSLKCVVTDAQGASVTSTNVAVTVTAAAAVIRVSPQGASLKAGEVKVFTATQYDQFGTVLAPTANISWGATGGYATLTPGGTFNGTATLTASATTGGPFTISATLNGRTGYASYWVSSNDQRLSPLVQAATFDLAAWNADTAGTGYRATYLTGIEPGRVWQGAAPGSGVTILMPTATVNSGSRFLTTAANTYTQVSVTTMANAPVTFLLLGEGCFRNDDLSDGRTVRTIQANGSGVATISVKLTNAGLGSILAASPMASGQVQFSVRGN